MLKVTEKISKNGSMAVLGMAMLAGLGVILIIIALGIGVIQGNAADGNTIGLLFGAGVALFILGGMGWFGLVQPHKHFDDINVPMEAEPHHDDHAAQAENH